MSVKRFVVALVFLSSYFSGTFIVLSRPYHNAINNSVNGLDVTLAVIWIFASIILNVLYLSYKDS